MKMKLRNTVVTILLVVGGVGLIGLVSYNVCVFMGKCYRSYDSTFQTIGICTEADSFIPLITPSVQSGQLFVCGKIEGSTPRPGVLYLYHEGKIMYFTTEFWHEVGSFSEPLPLKYTQVPGNYQVRIGYARRELAKFTFKVAD